MQASEIAQSPSTRALSSAQTTPTGLSTKRDTTRGTVSGLTLSGGGTSGTYHAYKTGSDVLWDADICRRQHDASTSTKGPLSSKLAVSSVLVMDGIAI